MSNLLTIIIEFTQSNWDDIQNSLIILVIAAYIFYGLLLALDARNRFRQPFMPFLVFIFWIFFSILFIPIYLLVRPDYGNADNIDSKKVDRAMLLGSELDICSDCEGIVKIEQQFCNECGSSLKSSCKNCKKQISKYWQICGFCGEAVDKEIRNSNKGKSVSRFSPKLNSTANKSSLQTLDERPVVYVAKDNRPQDNADIDENITDKEEDIAEMEKVETTSSENRIEPEKTETPQVITAQKL